MNRRGSRLGPQIQTLARFQSIAPAISTFGILRASTAIAELSFADVAPNVVTDREICKISIVGLGMRTHAGVAAKAFALLAGESINVQMVSTSEIKISVVVHERYGELALRVLHDGFGLGDPPA